MSTPDDATFILRLEPPAVDDAGGADRGGAPLRLAVKDLIDVAGTPTTAGSRLVAEEAAPATADAPIVASARAAGAVIVGKTNLYELAFGASGTNEWWGTPANPFDPGLVPGGSSSGSAVAVATGQADVAYGSDTGGSIRVPSACCGTAGLKTTFGRIAVHGVWPLAPSLDTVGPMAADVAGLVRGMALLEPGFTTTAVVAARTVGRIRLGGAVGHAVDGRIDEAVDAALRAAGFHASDVDVPSWDAATRTGVAILTSEAATANEHLWREPGRRGRLSGAVAQRLLAGAAVTASALADAEEVRVALRRQLAELLASFDVLALPTLAFFPPTLALAPTTHLTGCTLPVNLAGVPALSLPVPAAHDLPASLQLIAGPGGEEALLVTAALVEEAVGRGPWAAPRSSDSAGRMGT